MRICDVFEELVAREILDSRGMPTVEVELHTIIGVFRDSCPSGASTGANEAKTLLDKPGEKGEKGVSKAIFNVRTIFAPKIAAMTEKIADQRSIDAALCAIDGTPDKRRLGANAILPISLAFARAGAVSQNLSLREHVAALSGAEMAMPQPLFNVINGGMHSGNGLAFQEVMVTFSCGTFAQNLAQAALFYAKLRETVAKKYGALFTSVGDEGGFAPPVRSVDEALELIMATHDAHGFANMRIALDSAANSFFDGDSYAVDGKTLSPSDFVAFYVALVAKFPLIFSLEDPFAEDDAPSWKALAAQLRGKVKIVGDDLTVTNARLLRQAIDNALCDTLLVKINQVGTVSEALAAVAVARSAGMQLIVSHRSGETEDAFLSDFAVGIGAEFVKAGAPCRGERVAKYNQLLRIEEAMKNDGAAQPPKNDAESGAE